MSSSRIARHASRWSDPVTEEQIRLAQYENLRKHFAELISKVLGPGYWNDGMDVYECDRLACEDIALKLGSRSND